MRIAIVHSFYSSASPSGENDVVLTQMEALSGAGHDVSLFSSHTDDEELTPLYSLRAGMRVATGFGKNPSKEISDFEPQIIHVHNLFPNFASRWLRRAKAPIVVSVHNYRQFCANGLLYRDGQPCYKCPQGSVIASLVHRCYRESVTSTLPLSWSTRAGFKSSDVYSSARIITVPSERARSNLLSFGVPESQLRYLPYFVTDPSIQHENCEPRNAWILAGRLTESKGVRELVEAWPQDEVLEIAGTGPEAASLMEISGENVRFLGQLSQEDLTSRLPKYAGLIFPGRSPEGIPSIVLHALRAGIPTICRPGTGAFDLVAQNRVGAVYEEDTELAISGALDQVRTAGQEMRLRSRHCFEAHFTVDSWLKGIEDIYQDALETEVRQDL